MAGGGRCSCLCGQLGAAQAATGMDGHVGPEIIAAAVSGAVSAAAAAVVSSVARDRRDLRRRIRRLERRVEALTRWQRDQSPRNPRV